MGHYTAADGSVRFRVDTPADVATLIATLQTTGFQHRIPLPRALMAGRIAHIEVFRSGNAGTIKRFLAMVRKPAVALIGDDDEFPTGPGGYPLARRMLEWARVVIVHATGGQAEDYEAAVTLAEQRGRFLFIETNTAHLPEWILATGRWAPNALKAMHITPDGARHPVPIRPEARQ